MDRERPRIWPGTLVSGLALALIGHGQDTGSGPIWRTMILYGAIQPCPSSGLVLALTCPKWLIWADLALTGLG